MNVLFLLGRLLYGGYFVYNGINHLFLNPDALTGYAGSKGVPEPQVAVSGTGVMMLLGGTSVLLGYQPKIGTVLIMTFLLGVSPQMHDFWAIEDPGQRMNDMVNFTKNMALVGATLALMSRPEPWPLSLAGGTREETAESVRGRAAA